MSEHVLDQNNQGSSVDPALTPIYGLWGDSQQGAGIYGTSDGSAGTGGWSLNAIGAVGGSESFIGVYGWTRTWSYGVIGTGGGGARIAAGVAAFNPDPINPRTAAYLASDCCAAWLTGDVVVTGALSKAGGGFQIDHPTDPANKYLSHSFVESSEMKNIYDGMVVADSNGEADVMLPDWFEALNSEFRYQLTCVGAYSPVYVSEEIHDGHFRIAGANQGAKVCWQVSGVRHDEWAIAHRIEVEVDKDADERAHYLHPDLHGASAEMSIERVRHPRISTDSARQPGRPR